MKCGHLFNGIGGFAVAASWMGWENIFHCEIDEYCNKVMNRHFPNSIQHGDIKKQDFSSYRGTISLLSGGFPCTQTSVAAQIHDCRTGLAGPDSALWFEYLRAIKEITPPWVVVENVPGVKKWSRIIQIGLADTGYTVSRMEFEAKDCGLPHRRRRVFFIANAYGKRLASARQTGSPTAEWYKRLASSGGSWLTGTPGTVGIFNGIPHRVDRVTALGNAVVPSMAHKIFLAIEKTNTKI